MSIANNILDDMKGKRPFRKLNSSSNDEANNPPIHIFPKEFLDYIKEVSESLPCPVDYMFTFCLSVVSGLIGTTRMVKIKNGWTEFPTLFTAVVAEPSTKKSPAMRLAMIPVKEYQDRQYDKYLKDKEDYESYIRESKIHPSTDRKDPPKFEKLVSTDATKEALGTIFLQNPKGILYPQDELISLIKGMDQYKGGKGNEKQFWLSLWSNSSIQIDRKNQEPIYIKNPFITVFGGIQPDLIKNLNSIDRDGFINRFLFSFPEPIRGGWTDKEISELAMMNYKYKCKNMMDYFRFSDLEKEPIELNLDTKAIEVAKKFTNDLMAKVSKETNPLVKASLSKFEGYFYRFALIIQLLWDEKSRSVEEIAMNLSYELINYYEGQMRKTFRLLNNNQKINKYIKAIEKIRKNGGKISVRDFYKKKIVGITNAIEATKFLQELEKSRQGTFVEDTNKRGRRVISFQLYDD